MFLPRESIGAGPQPHPTTLCRPESPGRNQALADAGTVSYGCTTGGDDVEVHGEYSKTRLFLSTGRLTIATGCRSRRYYRITNLDIAGLDDFAPDAEGDVALAAELGQRVQDACVSCA